jgi:hypothetical protein
VVEGLQDDQESVPGLVIPPFCAFWHDQSQCLAPDMLCLQLRVLLRPSDNPSHPQHQSTETWA